MAVRHKRKDSASYSWQTSDLVEGQIGLNIADGTLHFKKSDNSFVTLYGETPVALQFTLPTGEDSTFTILQDSPSDFTITSAVCQSASGTITAAVKINGTNVTGLSAISISSTEGSSTATAANTVSTGDKITVALSSNSSATMVSICIKGVKG